MPSIKFNRLLLLTAWTTLTLVLCLGCSQDSKDQRATVDAQIGYLETSQLRFKADAGNMHILKFQDAHLHLRASAPIFQGALHNKTSRTQTLQITISNALLTNSITFNGAEAAPDSSTEAGLSRTWTITLNPLQTTIIGHQDTSKEPFEFLALGDIQDGIEDFAKVVSSINQQNGIAFILFLGDLTMRSEKNEFTKVIEAFTQMRYPVFSTPGNHDVNHAQRYQELFGKASYTWVYRDARFTSVDSASWTLSKATWDLYRTWLEKGQNQTHIVFSHIAPTEPFGLRGGHWKSRREANSFIAHSSRGDVDAMFFGHLHTLDMYQLAGIPTYISGGAGAFQELWDGIERHMLRVFVNPVGQQVSVQVIRID